MKKSLLPFVSLLCAAVLFAVPLLGDVPRTISYQGYLTDAEGAPLEGPVAMTFRLFGQLAEGTELWTEAHAVVQVDEGRFVAVLGSVTPLPADFSQPLFLEIQVAAEVLAPRLPLRSVPYALQAAKVGAGGVDAAAVQDGTIGKAKLGRDLAGAGLIQNSDGSLRVAGGGVVGTMLAEGAIVNSHIAANAGIEPGKIAGTAVTLGGSETLTNKTLDRSAISVRDSDFTIVSAASPAQTAKFQLDPLRIGTLQTLTLPGGDGTLALESYVTTQIAGLADVAASGSFADLGGVPAFARLDQPNIFTASSLALSIAPAMPYTDAVLLQILPFQPIRSGFVEPVFSVDAEGDVVAASFAGNGSLLDKLNADSLTSGTVSLERLPLVPAAKVDGLATVATSGSFADLGGVPAFARLDQSNTFTAVEAIRLDATGAAVDSLMLTVWREPVREGEVVFSVDSEGDVLGASFAGDGSLLTKLNASSLATGTVSLARLPQIPATKVDNLAAVGTSGSFADLVNVPAFARLDRANTFTAASLPISLEPTELLGDDILFRIMPPPPAGRPVTLFPVFSVNGYGVVTAASFVGDGSLLTELSADNITSGTLAVERLPVVPAAKLALAELAGPGLYHNMTNKNLGVDVGAGLAIDGGGKLVPDLDGKTIGTDGDGKLAVTAVASVPVVLKTEELTPRHGSLIFKDGALQVYDDPAGTGGVWIKIGTYQ